MRLTRPRSERSLVGSRRRPSKRGSPRPYPGSSITLGGGRLCAMPKRLSSGEAGRSKRPGTSLKILVTGTEGQVVTALRHRCAQRDDIELVTLGRPDIDLERPQNIAQTIAAARPNIVVSAAAWTAVDLAEDEPERAMRAN